LKNKKQDDLFKNRDAVKEILTAEILSRYYYQKGRIKGGLNFDPEFNKAVEILENEKEYNLALQKDSLNLEFEQK
jgi:carboxyl-terminal processing protease